MAEDRGSYLSRHQSPRQAADDAVAGESSSHQRERFVAASKSQVPLKRIRSDDGNSETDSPSVPLPPDNVIDGILDAYFYVVHPFIPILHEPLFRSRLRDQTERPKLLVVLHAILVCAVRYVANERPASQWLQSQPDALQKSRDFVVLAGMENLTVESIQALIIVAFVHICDGSSSKAWSIIGSLTRVVVYMGLHVEPEDQRQGGHCVLPFRGLSPAQIWTEAEERRRVFWNVFLLDR